MLLFTYESVICEEYRSHVVVYLWPRSLASAGIGVPNMTIIAAYVCLNEWNKMRLIPAAWRGPIQR